MSAFHHGPINDPVSNIADPIAFDGDLLRMSVINCLVPATVALATR